MFKPVNRHIWIEMQTSTKENNSLIVLPEDYQPSEEAHIEVLFKAAAPDVRFETKNAKKLVVDASMIEEIKIRGTIYNVILDNYVVGIVE